MDFYTIEEPEGGEEDRTLIVLMPKRKLLGWSETSLLLCRGNLWDREITKVVVAQIHHHKLLHLKNSKTDIYFCVNLLFI